MKPIFILFLVLFVLFLLYVSCSKTEPMINQLVLPTLIKNNYIRYPTRNESSSYVCEDSSTWYKKGFKDQTCKSYAKGGSNYGKNKCNEIGWDNNRAIDSCPLSCGTCPGQVTISRLPSRFRKNVKFLVTGVEHSFDGNGGWTTGLKTVMTMMK